VTVRLLAQACELKGHIPRFTSGFETLGEVRIPKLLLQVVVEVGFLHTG